MPTDEEILEQLTASRDRVISGDQAVSVLVTPNAHKTEFVKPDLARLDRRIEEMKAQIEARPTRGAIGFTF